MYFLIKKFGTIAYINTNPDPGHVFAGSRNSNITLTSGSDHFLQGDLHFEIPNLGGLGSQIALDVITLPSANMVDKQW